ncbi:MAG: hypothetical protein ACREHV_10400 [Rhizomicrobium sp.]
MSFSRSIGSWASLGLVAVATLVAAPGASFAKVTISADATQNIVCSNGVCAPTAAKATLNANDLQSLLSSGNVEITTTGSGVQATDIEVSAPLTWSSAFALTLDAYQSTSVDRLVSVTGTGGLSLTTNDGGNGGALSFGAKGKVEFANLSSALTINGTSYALVNSIAALASAIASNPAGAYALANDYDASKDRTYKSSPVPTELTGSFEGLGNVVSNLTIHFRSKTYTAAFFTAVGSSGSVGHIRLAHERVTAFGEAGAAGLVGWNYGSISGAEISGSFEGVNSAGLAGLNAGSIESSSTKVSIMVLGFAAGLVSSNLGTISRSHATGTVTSSGSGGVTVDGLVGLNRGGIIDQSFADVAVTGADGSTVGGLVGEDTGTVTNSYAEGAVTGGDQSSVGGLDGYGNGVVQDSYSTGAVSGGNESGVGGFIGYDEGSIVTDGYWDTTTSGTDQGTGNGNVTGLTGLTTEQLQAGLPKGFKKNIWAENPNLNNGLPYLKANPPPPPK